VRLAPHCEWAWRASESADASQTDVIGIADHLPRVDAASQARRLVYWHDIVKQLDAIAERDLSPAEAINYKVHRDQIGTLISQQIFRQYEKPFNSDSAFWFRPYATAIQTFRSAQDYRAYLAQLADVPRYFLEQTDNMRAGLKRGFTHLRRV
jgi:uncharacterized protein (DUF885 family)